MGAVLYSLLAIYGVLSSAVCLPKQILSTSQQLQSEQPTLNGLPSNSNVTLQYVALGVGVQNYTCDGAAWVQTTTGDGAFATLYDATSYLASHTSEISTLPAGRLAKYTTAREVQAGGNYLPFLTILGNHYFDENLHATFNLSHANPPLVLSAKKLDSVPSPTAGAIPWLYLLDANDGITDGLKAVYRLETAGGVAPTSCSGSGSQTSVPYAAEYWFGS